MEDREIALKLQSKLQGELCSEKVAVHVCVDTQGEKSWRTWIEDKINASKIMIFLYTVEHEEAWRWCMYEIGMFNGLRIQDKSRSLIFLKNPHIEDLPDPLRDVTFYVADSDGIDEFIDALLFEGRHTPNQYIIVNDQDKNSTWDKKYKRALSEIKSVFKRSRLSKEYYTYRITIELKPKGGENRENRIEKSTVIGALETMNILNIPRTSFDWEDLYRHCKAMGQVKWLDELVTVAEHVAQNNVVDRVLHPIRVKKHGRKDAYLPVVSSIEKMYPLVPDGEHEPTKINVIFIPQLLSQEGLLERLPTLIPFSKVKCWLDPSDDRLFKMIAQDDENLIIPQVVEMNNLCLRLYALNKEDFSRSDMKWTGQNLISRLQALDFVDPVNIEKLIEDQGRVIDQLLLKGLYRSEALIPLQFNDNHPYHPNQSFLPVIVSSQIEGDTTQRHVAHLLVAYVKDFWPADHVENPFNIKKERQQG
jgi:hypothetical protein